MKTISSPNKKGRTIRESERRTKCALLISITFLIARLGNDIVA